MIRNEKGELVIRPPLRFSCNDERIILHCLACNEAKVLVRMWPSAGCFVKENAGEWLSNHYFCNPGVTVYTESEETAAKPDPPPVFPYAGPPKEQKS